MSLIPGSTKRSLIQVHDLRESRRRDPSSVLRAEIADEGSVSDPTTLVEMELFVQKVSIFAEDGQSGKPVYSIMLELDTGPNPSNHPRRTEAVRGLALDVEEKEIPVLARLAGRGLEILLERRTSKLDFESQEREITDLQAKIKDLERKNGTLAEQLQFAMDQIQSISRAS
jgi:hypothetical protein